MCDLMNTCDSHKNVSNRGNVSIGVGYAANNAMPVSGWGMQQIMAMPVSGYSANSCNASIGVSCK